MFVPKEKEKDMKKKIITLCFKHTGFYIIAMFDCC